MAAIRYHDIDGPSEHVQKLLFDLEPWSTQYKLELIVGLLNSFDSISDEEINILLGNMGLVSYHCPSTAGLTLISIAANKIALVRKEMEKVS